MINQEQNLNIINEAIAEWTEENSPEMLKHKVKTTLDKNREKILLKLLGFNTRWGAKWELDHCNGRSGNSTAGDYLKQVQQEAINEWFKSIELPDVNNHIKRTFTKNYKESLNSAIQSKINAVIKTEINKIIDEDLTKLVDKAIYKQLEIIGLVTGVK